MPDLDRASRLKWVWHNTVGHILIGLIPVKSVFDYHDKTADDMNVKHWV